VESTIADRQTDRQTDRTIPNNKPHIVIRNNERGTCMLIDVAISGGRCDQERSREDSKIYRPNKKNSEHVKYEAKVILVRI
jgi:hypothetical protein